MDDFNTLEYACMQLWRHVGPLFPSPGPVRSKAGRWSEALSRPIYKGERQVLHRINMDLLILFDISN